VFVTHNFMFSTQVERVLSNPNVREIEKAKKLLTVS
jgi:hypothetical protein